MRTLATLAAGLLVGAAASALPAVAQEGPVHFTDAQVTDLEGMQEKFVSLGGAFPEELMDWRPMEGVRSVKDVLVLAAVECNLFPTMWGFDAPEGAGEGFGGERSRLEAMDQQALLAEVGAAFDHLIGLAGGWDDATRARATKFFGRDVDVQTALALAAFDMHEHLGQLIAYARTNRIVPPWSR